MKKAAKRAKPGRPPVYENPRISIAARLQTPLHARIKADAEAAGRSISEEIERRLTLSVARDDADQRWIDAENQVRKWQEEHEAALKNGFEAALRHHGYQPVHDTNGTFWAEPGMKIGKFNGVINPAIEEVLERVVERAIQKANKR